MRFPKLIKTRAQKSDRGRGARQTGRKSSNGLRPLASLAPRAAQCASARHWTTSRVVPPRCAAGAGRPCPLAARPRDTFRLGTGRREVGGPNRTGARAWRRPPPPRTRRRRRDAAKKTHPTRRCLPPTGLAPTRQRDGTSITLKWHLVDDGGNATGSGRRCVRPFLRAAVARAAQYVG
jgi:hypothetical protein